ncbi:MAG: lipoprotein insertase outer membrane protein LolB [Parahaliea sp.]
MRFLLTALLCMLAGCAGTVQIPSQDWSQHLTRLQALDHWQSEGKIALRNGGASESANLVWQQKRHQSELQLSGPLGMAATRIYSDGQHLQIIRGEDSQTFDISSQAAIEANTGWDLPLTSLPYWIRGIPDPNSHSEHMHIESHLLRELKQNGWRVQFGAYDSFEGYYLPTRLTLQRADSSARMIIRHWQVSKTP